MVNYQKAKIYKLVSNQTNKIYIGSTCQLLCHRKASHKRDYKNYMNGIGGYVTSFEIAKFDNMDIILIENYPCLNIEVLLARERYWIEKTPETVNKQHPGRTFKEYYELNKDRIHNRNKKYYEMNKEKINKKKMEYYKANKEHLLSIQIKELQCICGSTIQKREKTRHEKSKKHQLYLESHTPH